MKKQKLLTDIYGIADKNHIIYAYISYQVAFNPVCRQASLQY
ncbi:MAG: hypothetical protein U9Q98_09895 [Bacteroidota bacterium]|nr:hypothetical protein [Bacteroidota bacterium]